MEEQTPGDGKKKYQVKKVKPKTNLLNNRMISFVVFVCTFLLICFLAIANVTPQKYYVQVGSVSADTIEATKDIIDTFTTEANKKAASDSVSTKYTQDNTIQPAYSTSETTFFDGLIALKTKEYELIKARAQQAGTAVPNVTDVNLTSSLTDENYNALKTFAGIEMTKSEMKNAFSMSDADIEKLRAYVKQQTSEAYTAGFKQDALTQQIENILKSTKEQYSTLYGKIPNALNAFLTANLKPNIIEDTVATDKAKKEAEAAVKSVTYQKGQTIVRKGDVVTQAQYSVLEDLGIINNSSIDLSLYMGTGLYILLILSIFAYYIIHYEKKVLEQKSSIILLGLIICISVFATFILGKIDSRLNIIYYGALLCTAVFGLRLGAIVTLVLSLIITMVIKIDAGAQSVQAAYIAIASLIGVMAGLLYSKRSERSNYLRSGIVAGVVSALASAAILAVTNNDMMTLITTSGYMFFNAFLSSILLIGSMPIYESFFNILTDSKLLELSDPKNPLMKRLAMETPGTYHHSMLVANLAENAAEAIGANGLLARVGAYYHDVGKLRRPQFFAENQQGENPHDNLAPQMSASIILSHPKDGIRYANQYKLPKEVCDIIEQHHGTTTTAYFYDKAACENEEVNKDDFRYEGKKPVGKEAAIVMLADTVEAAIRSMPTKNEKDIKEKINKLVDLKMREGQLEESLLSFNELSKIKNAFYASYNGASHHRIEYPEIDWPDEKKV